VGVNVRDAVAPFFQGRLPEELCSCDPISVEFVSALLRAARGKMPMRIIANRTGLSRSAVSRILSGATEPRLPMFFRFIEACTRRLLDLLAGFVDVEALPAAESTWRKLEAQRRLAYDNPLSEAVPRFLELEQYAQLPRHRRGWIAERLGISAVDEDRTLRDLEAAGLTRFDGCHWQLDQGRSVDTSRQPEGQKRLVLHWTGLARDRIAANADGEFSYLVFGTDQETLASIQQLRLRFVRELRTMVRKAPVATRVMVANVHLFPIDVGPHAIG
jgi:transcriptional regulator with XRE-family HTH domain